jgi:hypothetical protein
LNVIAVGAEPLVERRKEHLSEESTTVTSGVVEGTAVTVAADVGTSNTPVGVGEMTDPGRGAQADIAKAEIINKEKRTFFTVHSPISISDEQWQYRCICSLLRLELNSHFSVRLRNRSTLLPTKPINAPRIKPIDPPAS